MKTNNLIKISGIVLLAVLASVTVLSLIYLLQQPQLVHSIVTVSWNG